MGFQVFILLFPRLVDILLKFSKQIIVPTLLVLNERLVLQRSFEIHHRVTHQLLHLERIEIFLVRNNVSQRCSDVLNLSELYSKHLVVLVKVLLDIIIGHTA